MTDAERRALYDMADEGRERARKTIENMRNIGALDPRMCAVALTEIDKAFATASMAVRLVKNAEEI